MRDLAPRAWSRDPALVAPTEPTFIVGPAQGHLRGLSACAAHVPKLQVAMLSLISVRWQSRRGKGCAEILLVWTFWWLKACF